jgi:DNA polymerase-3 subunit epsilon
MHFVAIDVETANEDLASICQIGIASYGNGVLTHEWKSLVDPEDDFDAINVSIHGITEAAVAGAPTFGDLAPRLARSLENAGVVASHTHFDRVAIQRAYESYDLAPPFCVWLDTARVARGGHGREWLDPATGWAMSAA